MKKFIAAFDGLKYSLATQEYAIRAARDSNAHLGMADVLMKQLRFPLFIAHN